MSQKRKKRALSPRALLNKKIPTLEFEGMFKQSFGSPARYEDCWLIWGNSGNGKTSFCLQLAKYLTNFGKVIYDSIEEGHSSSIQAGIVREGLDIPTVSSKILFLHKETLDELSERLLTPRSADFVIIDSVQFLGLKRSQFNSFCEKHRDKLLIWISHADGKKPDGKVASWMQYAVGVKIWIEGYTAFPTSRYGGNNPFIIDPKLSMEYWGNK